MSVTKRLARTAVRRPIAVAILAALGTGVGTNVNANIVVPDNFTPTRDATVLSFQVQVDAGVNALQFEYMFGTEEFPNFGDFNDIAAVFINGRNVTGFSDGSPLVASNETFSSQFTDNTDGTGGGGPVATATALDAGTSPFTVFNPGAGDVADDLADHLLGTGLSRQGTALYQGAGQRIDDGDDGYGGGDDGYGGGGDDGFISSVGSASSFADLDLDPDGSEGRDFSLTGNGILLTTGEGVPPSTNTEGGFSGRASGQGDRGLDALLFAAGIGSGFDNGNDDEGEGDFPNLPPIDNELTPQLAAFAVGDDDESSSSTAGASPLDIEYDGVSAAQTITVALSDAEVGQLIDIKIAVSDEGDQIFDSALFIANLEGVTLEPGQTPGNPLLPPPGAPTGDGFEFAIIIGEDGLGLDPTTPLWIDPIVAVGYTYELSADEFQSVQLPAFGPGPGSVADADGYTITFSDDNGNPVTLFNVNPGDTVAFTDNANVATGVTSFNVSDIDPDLEIDPTDPAGFGVGVTFAGTSLTAGTTPTPVTLTITPDTFNTDVPEPGTLALLGLGLLAFSRRIHRRVGA